MIIRTFYAIPLLLLILLSVSNDVTAQSQPFDVSNFPESFGPSNVGREFYVAFPANLETGQPVEKYIRLYISSHVATNVDIYAAGQLKGSVTTIPNDIVTFDLSPLEAQLLIYDGNGVNVPDDALYAGKAVKIIADDPVVVYGLNRTAYTSDGMLVLPVNGLGREYVVASAASNVPRADYDLPSQFMVIAPYDNTSVTITYSDNTPNHSEGEEVTITMNEGDVYSSMSTGFKSDLSGAVIRASNPIAVTAGQNCTYLPDENYPACDHIEEMLIPVEAWGNAYQAVPFQNRTRGDTYRIFAAEPDTKVYVNGQLFATIPNGGGPAGSGFVEYREEEVRALDFTSDKRIFVAQYNNGQTYDGSAASDPFYTILTPVGQFQTEFMFATPGNSFPQYFINLVGDSAALANAEITKIAPEDWSTITSLPNVKRYAFPTEISGKKYAGANFPLMSGVYRIRSTGPVAGYIYAGGTFDSFGYPLATAVRTLSVGDIPTVDTEPPTIESEVDCMGLATGTVSDAPNDVNIRTNINSLELTAGSENYRLTHPRIRAGIDRNVPYELTVIDPLKEAVAILVASDNAGNLVFDTVNYVPSILSLDTNSIELSNVQINQEYQAVLTVTNPGSESMVVAAPRLVSGDAGFSIVEPTGGFMLASGETRSVTVAFSSASEGLYTDSLLIEPECGPARIAVITASVGDSREPAITVGGYSFAGLKVGATSTGTITVSSVGTAPLTITEIIGPSGGGFTVTGSLPALPKTLNPAESIQIEVTFAPTEVRRYEDSIVVIHNAGGTPPTRTVAYLDGDGVSVGVVGSESNTAGTWMRVSLAGASGPQIALQYRLNQSSDVMIELYDVEGRIVDRVDHGLREAGINQSLINGDRLPSGTYYAVLTAGTLRMTEAVTIRR